MEANILIQTARAIFANNKGILAMDESIGTCNKRFAEMGIPQTEDYRRAYREWILTSPNLGNFISGVILFDETIRQKKKDGTPFLTCIQDAGILPGIKVDMGAKDLAGHPGEKITEGLDGLRERFQEYATMGAKFAKWRAVITIGPNMPTRACLEANTQALARYAALCQEANLVPIVEPEVLMDGNHSLERCAEVSLETLHTLFNALYHQNILLEGMILKPNMVISGLDSPVQASIEDVAQSTLECLRRNVPAAVGGIAFLSGGQSSELATAHLNRMHKTQSPLPWDLSFSFGRALQEPALSIWKGEEANIEQAQKALLHRAECNYKAVKGEYTAEMEK